METNRGTSRGQDWISNLPDEVLASIVSRLEMDEAAATGILSTRWKNIWRSQYRLDFNPRKMTRLGRECSFKIESGMFEYSMRHGRFMRCSREEVGVFSELLRKELIRATRSVGAILKTHPHDIRSCRIVHFQHNFKHRQVERWIKYLKDRGIEELGLTMDEETLVPSLGQIRLLSFKLPKATFRCATLKVLEFTNYWELSVDPFMGCKNLRKLRLHQVQIVSNVLHNIIQSCEFLEELCMSRCPRLTSLSICSGHLKVLELKFLTLTDIDIQSESLEVMVLDRLFCSPDSMVINAPNVIGLRTNYCAEERIRGRYQENHLRGRAQENHLLESKNLLAGSLNAMKKGTGNICPFKKLQELSIRCDLNKEEDVELLSQIVRELKELEILNTINQVKRRILLFSVTETESLVPNNLHKIQDELKGVEYSLQKVSITGFRGDPLACTFARSFLTNARNLREFRVDCCGSCSEEQRNQMHHLLSVPKASSQLSIVVKHGGNCLERNGGVSENHSS